MGVANYLNTLDAAEAQAALGNCCASKGWITAMNAARPFAADAAVLQAAADAWSSLAEADWREAFAAHPKIGDAASLGAKYAATSAWAGREQSGVAGASADTLRRLAELNREYEEKFGYIFIVCATGKSADEMLALLTARLPNNAPTEIRIAAAEQLKITLLRLQKLAQ